MSYSLYVDESGEPGLKKIRDGDQAGASPFMTMGGVLVPNEQKDDIRNALEKLRGEILNQKTFHCKSMRHEEKVRLAQFISELPVVLVGVVSHKRTLGAYKDEINENHHLYYNKCCQYLLERAGMVAENLGLDAEDLDINMEEGNFDYGKLRNLILKCQKNPQRPNTHFLRHLSAYKIQPLPKGKDPLLQIADLVAHALYRSVWGGKLEVTETRYLDEIKSKFFKDAQTGKALGKGLHVIHKPADLNLSNTITKYLSEF